MAVDRIDGEPATRRVAISTSGSSAHPKPSGQRICKAIGAEKVKVAAAMSEAISPQPSSLASRYVPSAASKNAIDAVKPKLAATGSSNASRVNGLKGAD